MIRTFLPIILCTFGITAQTFGSGASAVGNLHGGTCNCLQPNGSAGGYAFNFTVSATSGCKPAKGTVSLTDTACGNGTFTGKITKVEVFDAANRTFAVHGVVANGPLKKQPFRLKFSQDVLSFVIVSGPCNSDCQGFSVFDSPGAAVTFVP